MDSRHSNGVPYLLESGLISFQGCAIFALYDKKPLFCLHKKRLWIEFKAALAPISGLTIHPAADEEVEQVTMEEEPEQPLGRTNEAQERSEDVGMDSGDEFTGLASPRPMIGHTGIRMLL